MGEVEGFIKSWASASERRKGSQRTRDAIRLRAQRGHVAGGRVYGYRIVKVDGHSEREIVPKEAETIRRIFRRRGEGWGVYRICRELETLGIPSPRGKNTWTQAQVSIICRNELYHGAQVWGRTRGVKRKGTHDRVESPESIVRTEVPALRIVDEVLWRAVQQQMDRATEYHKAGHLKSSSSPGIGPGLLSPIISCGLCGGGMHLRAGKDRRSGKLYPSYVCTRNATKGKRACKNGHRLPAERADEAIISAFEDQWTAGDGEAIIKIIMGELSRMQRAGADREMIAANIVQVEQEIQRGVKALMSGDSPAITQAVREREADLSRLREQLVQIAALQVVDFKELVPLAMKRLADWKGYLRSNPDNVVQSIPKKVIPTKIAFTPGEKGAWTFKGRTSYAKLLEGILPKVPRTGPSSSW